MKHVIATGLAFGLATLVSNAMAADAHQVNCGGPDFSMYYGADSTCGVQAVDGFYHTCSGPRYVSGCADRVENGTTGETALVDFYNSGPAANVSCTLWSVDYDGTPNTGVSGYATVTGYMSIILSLTSATAPTSSYTSVYCYLPNGVRLLGVTKY